jgi:hypothetical protein
VDATDTFLKKKKTNATVWLYITAEKDVFLTIFLPNNSHVPVSDSITKAQEHRRPSHSSQDAGVGIIFQGNVISWEECLVNYGPGIRILAFTKLFHHSTMSSTVSLQSESSKKTSKRLSFIHFKGKGLLLHFPSYY